MLTEVKSLRYKYYNMLLTYPGCKLIKLRENYYCINLLYEIMRDIDYIERK